MLCPLQRLSLTTNLGIFPSCNDKPAEALRYLQTAAEMDPKSSKIHFALRRTYSRLGRTEEAKKELDLYNVLKAAENASESNTTISAESAQ